jgi:hypothetical protein
VCLTRPSFHNTSAIAAVVALTTTMADRVEVAFRDGGGVSYDEQPDELSALVDRLGRPRYDALLVDAYLRWCPVSWHNSRPARRWSTSGAGAAMPPT